MKLIAIYSRLLVIIVVILSIAYFALGLYGLKCPVKRPTIAPAAQTQADMPTFEEIQEELVRRGHNIEVDGRIGKQTLNAWDAEICDQEASKMFERMEAGK